LQDEPLRINVDTVLAIIVRRTMHRLGRVAPPRSLGIIPSGDRPNGGTSNTSPTARQARHQSVPTLCRIGVSTPRLSPSDLAGAGIDPGAAARANLVGGGARRAVNQATHHRLGHRTSRRTLCTPPTGLGCRFLSNLVHAHPRRTIRTAMCLPNLLHASVATAAGRTANSVHARFERSSLESAAYAEFQQNFLHQTIQDSKNFLLLALRAYGSAGAIERVSETAGRRAESSPFHLQADLINRHRHGEAGAAASRLVRRCSYRRPAPGSGGDRP
jgi:hypothetical protein